MSSSSSSSNTSNRCTAVTPSPKKIQNQTKDGFSTTNLGTTFIGKYNMSATKFLFAGYGFGKYRKKMVDCIVDELNDISYLLPSISNEYKDIIDGTMLDELLKLPTHAFYRLRRKKVLSTKKYPSPKRKQKVVSAVSPSQYKTVVKKKTPTKRKSTTHLRDVTVVSPSASKKTVAFCKSHTPTKRKKTAVKKKEVSVFLEVDEYLLLRDVIHSASTIYSASRNASAMACKLRRRTNELKQLRKDTERVVDKMFNM